MSKGTTPRAIRIEDPLWNEALRVAQENGETISGIVRDALRAYIQSHK